MGTCAMTLDHGAITSAKGRTALLLRLILLLYNQVPHYPASIQVAVSITQRCYIISSSGLDEVETRIPLAMLLLCGVTAGWSGSVLEEPLEHYNILQCCRRN
jgi:hypothetical protein